MRSHYILCSFFVEDTFHVIIPFSISFNLFSSEQTILHRLGEIAAPLTPHGPTDIVLGADTQVSDTNWEKITLFFPLFKKGGVLKLN
jgi:hypothetical protein